MKTPVKILLIEDNPADARLVQEWLKEAGVEQFQLEHADRLDTGLKFLNEKSFDAVLLDLGLPDSQGLGALKAVRAQAPATPVVVLTGLSDEAVGMKAVQEGAQDYLIKGEIQESHLIRSLHYARERRRMEEKLRRTEEDYRSLAENSPDLIARFDRRLRHTYVNPVAARAGRLSPSEYIGKTIAESGVPEPAAGEWEQRIRRVLETGQPMDVEDAFPTPDGLRYFHTRLTPELAPDGRVYSVLSLARDITERRNLEEQLLQAQKMEAVGRLAGGVAHDFNNLLTAIMGYSELALDALPEDHPEHNHIEEIRKAGERAAALTRQLLAFSRKQIFEPEVLCLNEVVSGMTKMLKRMIPEDVELVAVLDPGLERVKLDPTQMEQVLLNLAVNARDAMPGGGKLTLETANVELDVAYAKSHPEVQPGHYVMLAVSDTGCGMDEATKARIFEPFFTTKEKSKGTGLGLSTVYGIVKQSGGSIFVYSEPGKGTAFKIYLPRVEEALEPQRASAGPREQPKGAETVLVAEDDETLRRLIYEILQSSGYAVLEAGRGEEALRLAGEHAGPIHLLITDMVMPGMGGREVAGRLAALRPGTRVLFVSGYTDDAIVRHGVLESGLAFLQKPFVPEALLRKVREVLDGPEGPRV
jgi:PAS domain S-box-containing protein